MSTPSNTTFLGTEPNALLPGLFITLIRSINTPLKPSWEPVSETTASVISNKHTLTCQLKGNHFGCFAGLLLSTFLLSRAHTLLTIMSTFDAQSPSVY